MMQFVCGQCDSEEWTVHGDAGLGNAGPDRPEIREIRCIGCGNSETVA